MKNPDKKQAMLDGVALACRIVSKSITKAPDNRTAEIKKTGEKMYPQVISGKLRLSDALAELMYLTNV